MLGIYPLNPPCSSQSLLSPPPSLEGEGKREKGEGRRGEKAKNPPKDPFLSPVLRSSPTALICQPVSFPSLSLRAPTSRPTRCLNTPMWGGETTSLLRCVNLKAGASRDQENDPPVARQFPEKDRFFHVLNMGGRVESLSQGRRPRRTCPWTT